MKASPSSEPGEEADETSLSAAGRASRFAPASTRLLSSRANEKSLKSLSLLSLEDGLGNDGARRHRVVEGLKKEPGGGANAATSAVTSRH